MLYPILFILITAAIVVGVCVTRDMQVFAALNMALIGLLIMVMLGFTSFAICAGCFTLVHAIRIAIKYSDKKNYDAYYTAERKNVKFVYGKLAISVALLLLAFISKCTEPGLTQNFIHFEIAFFASIAIVFSIETGFGAGILLGGTFNPITQKKTAPNSQGGISAFGIACSILSIIVICCAYYSIGNSFKHVVVVAISGIIGYSVYVLIGALLTKNDEAYEAPQNAGTTDVIKTEEVVKEVINTSENNRQQLTADANILIQTEQQSTELEPTNELTTESQPTENLNNNVVASENSDNENNLEISEEELPITVSEKVKAKFFDIYQTSIISEICGCALAVIIGLFIR